MMNTTVADKKISNDFLTVAVAHSTLFCKALAAVSDPKEWPWPNYYEKCFMI